MNLIELLKFLPLVIGIYFAYHLIFKQQLPTKSIGAMLTYFLGIILVLLAVTWLITSFLADWATNLLQEGTTTEWQQFIDTSENVVDNAFTDTNSPPAPQPTVVQIVVTATPLPGGTGPGGTGPGGTGPGSGGSVTTGPTQHTVVAGDTLYDIAKRYNTTIDAIMIANGLHTYIIHPGQVLNIPAPVSTP
jgi:LysM repeat protein